MPSPRQKIVKALLRLTGPVILVLVVASLDDPGALWRSFTACDPWLLVLAMTLNVFVVHLRVVRWQQLLEGRGIHYATGRAWLSYLTSAYLALLTPGRVGDLLRVQYLRRERDVPYPEGLASVVMDRFADLYVLAAFVAVAAVHYGPILAGELAWATWACVFGTLVGPLVFLLPGVPERVFLPVFRKVGNSGDGFALFLAALRAQLRLGMIARVLPVTLGAFFVNYAQGWLISEAMGIHLAFFDVVCLLAIASLLGLLPISVSGVGVREAFFALLFPALGLAAEQGVTYGLLVLGVLYLVTTAAGFVAWQVAPPPTGSVEAATGVPVGGEDLAADEPKS